MSTPTAPTPAPAEVAVVEAAGEVVVDDELDPGWEHERLEFAGDRLAVRAPTQQALAGFSLASSKYVPSDVKNDMTGLFISEHLGPESYGRIMQRLMDGDDPDYTTDTIGTIMREIVMLRLNADKADDEG
jgi:hypothetical protein